MLLRETLFTLPRPPEFRIVVSGLQEDLGVAAGSSPPLVPVSQFSFSTPVSHHNSGAVSASGRWEGVAATSSSSERDSGGEAGSSLRFPPTPLETWNNNNRYLYFFLINLS